MTPAVLQAQAASPEMDWYVHYKIPNKVVSVTAFLLETFLECQLAPKD